MNRFVDWLALTRRGQITAGLTELALIVLAVALPRAGDRLSRDTTEEASWTTSWSPTATETLT
jgi:hypothetical protein